MHVGHHVADEERRIAARRLRQVLQRRRHVRARAVGPHRALRDLGGELHHAPAQRRERERRQPAHLLVVAREGRATNFRMSSSGLPGRIAETLVRRPVAHADAEPEAPARQLVHDAPPSARTPTDAACRCWRCWCRTGSRAWRARALRTARARRWARTVDSGESFALDALRELERRAPPSRHRHQTHCGLLRHRARPPLDGASRRQMALASEYTCPRRWHTA